MSFLVELDVAGITPEQGRAVEAACRERGAWPVKYVGGAPKRLFRRRVEPGLWMPVQVDREHLISDAAEWDQPFWDLEPDVRPKLAEAFRILGALVPQGFSFRATWVGDEVRETVVLSAGELADFAAQSRINEYTRYVVPPA